MGVEVRAVEPFDLGDLRGWVVAAVRPGDLEASVRRLIDPQSALSTLHWGRNYLYSALIETKCGPLPVAVKQFRNSGLGRRLKRRLRGSKAERSWRVGRALLAAGIATPEPLLLVESTRPDGPSWLVTRLHEGVFEARYLFRAIDTGREAELFPAVEVGRFLTALAEVLRRLHDAGFWHRDMSSGNVLVECGDGASPGFHLVDLNRTRVGRRPSVSERSRDLCRLMVHRREHQELFLRAYWGDGCRAFAWKRRLYLLYHYGFRTKNRVKGRIRGALRALRGAVLPRRPYAHIPQPPRGAPARDRVVWDHLSDQPHQHAGRLAKLGVRARDAGTHAAEAAALARSLPRIWRRYRALGGELYRRPVPFRGTGVCVRPWPRDPAALLTALDGLGVRSVLLRLHPWESDHAAEEELARELAARGYELAFALPQNRDLVREPERWRAAVEAIAERFTPFGHHFQVGQAINRSKWGIWTYREFSRLARTACEILRRYPGVEVLGPAVIDFEYHATAAVLNLRHAGFHFDAVASLLYVDRRGAPENRQAGFDTVGKVVLLKAIAETARNSEGRSWITEVNWPLWEGPHSPAGRSVAVDEETQADYLVRYYLLTLTTGLVERVFWWQMIARGYGLIDPTASGLRRRPAYAAFRNLVGQLADSVSEGPLPVPEPAHLFRFRRPDGSSLVVGWSAIGCARAELPGPAVEVVSRDGETAPSPGGTTVELTPSPRYFRLPPADP